MLKEDSIWIEIEVIEVGPSPNYFACKHCRAKAQIYKQVMKEGQKWVGSVFGHYEYGTYSYNELLPESEWTADHKEWCRLK